MVCNRREHTLLVMEVMPCMLNLVEGIGSVLYVAEDMRRVVVGLYGVGCRGYMGRMLSVEEKVKVMVGLLGMVEVLL